MHRPMGMPHFEQEQIGVELNFSFNVQIWEEKDKSPCLWNIRQKSGDEEDEINNDFPVRPNVPSFLYCLFLILNNQLLFSEDNGG